MVLRNYPGYLYRAESIVDDNTKGKKASKPCTHSKIMNNVFYSPAQHLLEQDLYLGLTTQWRTGNLASHIANQFSTTGDLLNFTLPTLASQGSSVIKELFIGCLPTLNDGNSAVNFLLELKDVRTLVRTASNLRRLISKTKRTVRNFRTAARKSKRTAARKSKQLKKNSESLALASAKASADVHLSYSFGIAPFINDVKRMYHTMRTLRDRIEWLEKNNDKVLKRHKRIRLTSPTFIGGNEQYYTGSMLAYYSGTWGAGTVSLRFNRRFIVPPVLVGTLKYKYSLTSSVPLKDKISTYLSAFGVEANPKIAWDAIPFSFLVDWVVDVGEFLGSFKIDALGIQTVVLDYCYSIKYHAICDCWVSEYNPYRQKPTPYILVRQAERSYYERAVGVPNLNTVDVSGLGSREFLLGGSLVLAGSNPGKPLPSKTKSKSKR